MRRRLAHLIQALHTRLANYHADAAEWWRSVRNGLPL